MGAWKNANSLVVANDGEIQTASAGTAIPSDVAVLPTGWTGMGLLDTDGITVTVTPNVQDFFVFQSKQPARRETVAQEILLAFKCAQWDEQTIPFSMGGGVVTGSDPYVYQFPSETQVLEERAIAVDVKDGSEIHRFTFLRGNVTEAVEATFNRENLATLAVGYKVLGPIAGGSPGKYITNSTAFAAGS